LKAGPCPATDQRGLAWPAVTNRGFAMWFPPTIAGAGQARPAAVPQNLRLFLSSKMRPFRDSGCLGLWNYERGVVIFRAMRKSDVTCPECKAGYRRIELVSRLGTKGEFRCLLCDYVLEVFDGLTEVAIRLTVQPEKTFE
jgi:rubredoxin